MEIPGSSEQQERRVWLKRALVHGLWLHSRYHGRFSCANAETGTTLWEDAPNRGNSASLVVTGLVILALTVNSELTALKPSDKAYIELAHFKVADTEIWAHPVVSGNRVFCGSVKVWLFGR